jgi:hypothetical protein
MRHWFAVLADAAFAESSAERGCKRITLFKKRTVGIIQSITASHYVSIVTEKWFLTIRDIRLAGNFHLRSLDNTVMFGLILSNDIQSA